MKLTVVLLWMGLTTCYGQPEWITYRADKYRIKYPENWQLILYDSGKTFSLLSPQSNDSLSDDIHLLIEDLDEDERILDSYTRLWVSNIKEVCPKVSIKTNKLLDGKREVIYTAAFAKQRGRFKFYYKFKRKCKEYCWVKNGKGYILRFNASQDTFESLVQEATGIMDSFKIDD